MKARDKQTVRIINAAEKAVAKIADPAIKAKATAELLAIQKKLNRAPQPTKRRAVSQRKARERDLDFER